MLDNRRQRIKQLAIIEIQEGLLAESEQDGGIAIQSRIFKVQCYLPSRDGHSLRMPTGNELLGTKCGNRGSQGGSLKAWNNKIQVRAIQPAQKTRVEMILMFVTHINEALFLRIRQFCNY